MSFNSTARGAWTADEDKILLANNDAAGNDLVALLPHRNRKSCLARRDVLRRRNGLASFCNKWTAPERAQLAELVRAGKTAVECAAQLPGRTSNGIRQQLKLMRDEGEVLPRTVAMQRQPEEAEDLAARLATKALHAATVAMYERKATRLRITTEVAMLSTLYSISAVEAFTAQQAA